MPVLSKIFEKIKFFGLYNQIYKNLNSILSKYQTGCQNGYRSQYPLIVMFERWRESLDKGGKCGGIVYRLIQTVLLLTTQGIVSQIISVWISYSYFKLISSFLSNRKYRTKMNFAYGNLEDLLLGVPQESVLEPLLFNR